MSVENTFNFVYTCSMIFLLDFFIFLLVLISVIFAPLVSLPFFAKILSDQTLLPQFIFIFSVFLAFLLYLLKSLALPRSYHLIFKYPHILISSFALFSVIVFLETLYTVHPAFSFTTKQISLINVDSLLPGLSWIALFFLFLIFITNPFVQKFKKILFPFFLVLSFLSVLSNLGYLKDVPRLSLSSSWQIAISQIGVSPLVGSGPGQFIRAFDKFRPVELNNSGFWQFKFANSSNEYLDILTTTGLLGFGAYLLFLFTVLKLVIFNIKNNIKEHQKTHLLLSVNCYLLTVICLLFSVLLAFFIPFTLPLRIIFILLVALALESGWQVKDATGGASRGAPSGGPVRHLANVGHAWGWRATGPVAFIITATLLLSLISYFRAELSFQQALQALNQNKPQDAYQKNLEAINFFPYKDSYHLTLSQISLAWANALSQSANRRISSEQKTLVGQLLGQAINQAKLAVTLAPQKSANLENLGIIYKNLIGVASDADRWSLAAFTSASQLSPFHPALQLEIGGVYFIDKNYLQAEKYFLNSLFLKPDYANGFYNLALAQHAQNKLSDAQNSLKKAIALTTPGSTDFQNAQKQLSLWNQEESTSSSQLSP